MHRAKYSSNIAEGRRLSLNLEAFRSKSETPLRHLNGNLVTFFLASRHAYNEIPQNFLRFE
jgi:hypothetical protein